MVTKEKLMRLVNHKIVSLGAKERTSNFTDSEKYSFVSGTTADIDEAEKNGRLDVLYALIPVTPYDNFVDEEVEEIEEVAIISDDDDDKKDNLDVEDGDDKKSEATIEEIDEKVEEGDDIEIDE
jgi:hypothetical protein